MNGRAARMLPYLLSFFSSFCIMILELVASRLVANHVGASLTVWTSVIGIMLGGICLGNVLGGRLADRVEPGRAIGPLYALGAFLTLSCLWMNAAVGFTPGLDGLSWNVRTVLVVTLDFLIPATVLGMIGPVVAKMAVEAARKAGSAIGDIYFFGAIGSIAGTFLAGFILMYLAPISAIVTLVAAALAVLAAVMLGSRAGLVIGLLAAAFLGVGSIGPVTRSIPMAGVTLGSITVNLVALVGHLLTTALAVVGLSRLIEARRATAMAEKADAIGAGSGEDNDKSGGTSLADLAALSFIASLAFMALEMVAGRLVTRHLGSSIYGWTSIIGVLLGGLSLGNFLGGKVADFIKSEKQASWLFLIASLLTLSVLALESSPKGPASYLFEKPLLSYAISLTKFPGTQVAINWPARVLLVVTAVFFLPSLSMGTVSPVVAKLAVDRMRKSKRTGRAIGQVYAWGMIGSILGTFLAGFVLIDVLGTKGLLLVLATVLAFSATALGSVWHAAWAGIPLGLCVIAFAPVSYFEKQGLLWGIREPGGDPGITADGNAWVDESNYYYIKTTNEPDDEGLKRTLVLDNLIHGYFVLGHPERLDYDYEHIYGLVAHRIAQAKAKAAGAAEPADAPLKTLFLGGGAYTFQRYMQHKYPKTDVDVAEIDPAVKRANQIATGFLPFVLPDYEILDQLPKDAKASEGAFLEDANVVATDGSKIKSANVVIKVAGQRIELGEYTSGEARNFYESLKRSTFPTINTVLGDARQFVERNQGKKQYDIVFGDAFNDFSVPWHLTTREFNDKLAKMMSPDGVYMINIIDAYASEEQIDILAERRIAKEDITSDADKERVRREERANAYRLCGFLGAWARTARLTFPYVYIFGTGGQPGSGRRETFVVVASKKELKLDDLGSVDTDPKFFEGGKLFEPRPFNKRHEEAVERRARGIVLTDDYAPVENLLAPIAETRGDDDE